MSKNILLIVFFGKLILILSSYFLFKSENYITAYILIPFLLFGNSIIALYYDL